MFPIGPRRGRFGLREPAPCAPIIWRRPLRRGLLGLGEGLLLGVECALEPPIYPPGVSGVPVM